MGNGGVGNHQERRNGAQFVGEADTGFYSLFYLLYSLFFTDDRWSPLQ